LSTVWVLADIFEQDLGLIRLGQEAKITVPAYPDRTFTGKVAFIYPSINRETRTAKVRVEIPNPDLALKADMYASAEIAAPVSTAVVAVPDSAVLDSGTRQVVLVERGEGRFEPRPVKLGQKAGGYVEVREGVTAGEKVVVGANFLIDAESNLRAALQAFTAPPASSPEARQ
jgi:Cu(I)/Ag(I) efflux system membrane fusion protein